MTFEFTITWALVGKVLLYVGGALVCAAVGAAIVAHKINPFRRM